MTQILDPKSVYLWPTFFVFSGKVVFESSFKCKVSNCRNIKSGSVKVFSLPKAGQRRDLCLKRIAINYGNCSVENLFVCSFHFVSVIADRIGHRMLRCAIKSNAKKDVEQPYTDK
ncbi:hypothetical protein OUZ56_032078 [Daphnia magna]|uniref:THAP-type domain-containing protein n=1 Tax=Daphnia magna TaxID=35525 RepID=A0ABQ9ZWV8_9CRUS|nr:hypothetical protein OUZ56_032078 [Daphnia magna]